MKILISWLAKKNDFNLKANQTEEKVRTIGPTYLFYKHFWKDYDKHFLLSSEESDDLYLESLCNRLRLDFPGRDIQETYTNVADVINLSEIKAKLESFLLGLEAEEIDIFISPGTPAMQTAWYLLQAQLDLPIRLLQMRSARDSSTGEPELVEIATEISSTPTTAIISQQLQSQPSGKATYKLTTSIAPIYSKARKVAETHDVTALILGATGTGKEHLAHYIHQQSARKTHAFVPINCSAFNDELLESRLFGYKKGAFTGAHQDTKGIFESAHRGTVFLDEIGDISPNMQQALLRVMQEKEISRIGESKIRKVDVRIIAATHRDLLKLCEEGSFRWDLYYRLAVAELELPSLLERGKKELEEMIDFFVKSEKKKLRKSERLRFTREVKAALLAYPWPGNLRELENLIRRLYVFVEKEVELSDLPKRLLNPPEAYSLHWKDVEKRHIEKVLRFKKGNQRQTNIAIGYKSITTLRNKIVEYGIEVPG